MWPAEGSRGTSAGTISRQRAPAGSAPHPPLVKTSRFHGDHAHKPAFMVVSLRRPRLSHPRSLSGRVPEGRG